MSGVNKKYRRADNWSNEERLLLCMELKKKITIINDKQTDKKTNNLKKEAWVAVNRRFNALNNGKNRDLDALKTQWKRMKCLSKQNHFAYKRGLKKIGGGVLNTPEPSFVDQKVRELVPFDFVKDDSRFDSKNSTKTEEIEDSGPVVGSQILKFEFIDDTQITEDILYPEEIPALDSLDFENTMCNSSAKRTAPQKCRMPAPKVRNCTKLFCSQIMADTKVGAEVEETDFGGMMKGYFELIRRECALIMNERSLPVILYHIQEAKKYVKKCEGLGAATGEDLELLQAIETIQDAMQNYFQAFVEYYNTGDYAKAFNHINQAINLFDDNTRRYYLDGCCDDFYDIQLIDMRKFGDIILKSLADE